MPSSGSQGERLDDFGSRGRALADDAIPTMRLEPDDRADGDPRGMVVDRAHLPLPPMDEHQPRTPLRCVDRQGATFVAEPGDPRREVVHVPGEIDQGGADRGEVRRRGRGRAGDPLEQGPDRRIGASQEIRHSRRIRVCD